MAKHRLFLGVDPSAKNLESLVKFQEEIRGSFRTKNCRWSPKSSIHLTLHFLGAVEEEKIAVLIEKMKVVEKEKAVDETLNTFVAFPHMESARVAGIGTAADLVPQSTSLHETSKRVLEALNIQVEPRKFRPHITLTRFSFPQDLRKLPYANVEPIIFEISALNLYESHLEKSGSRYVVLNSFILTKSL